MMNDRVKKNKVRQTVEKQDSRRDVRAAADNITDMLDKQAVENFELNSQVNKYKSELRHALEQLEEHTYCPGEVDIQCKSDNCKGQCQPQAQPQVQQAVQQEAQHGDDCHCSKCCPNPNPTFFQKHKNKILAAIVFICVLILSIGWLPSGGNYEALQKAYVELIVNLPKMVLLSVAGFAIFKIAKSTDDKKEEK